MNTDGNYGHAQMSVETKNIVGPLFGHNAYSPASAIYEALYERAHGAGVPQGYDLLMRVLDVMTPLVERVAYLDNRIARYTERVRGRVEQLRLEAMAPAGRVVNNAAASYRILSDDAAEAAQDAGERGDLSRQLAALAQLIRTLQHEITGGEFIPLGSYWQMTSAGVPSAS